ncbi:MAG: anthranilate phosphoribosyltransferase [Acidobacteriota bacterium]
MKTLVDPLLDGAPVDLPALEDFLRQVMAGEVEPVQVAAVLVALRTRAPDGPTLAAMARVMREHRLAVSCQARPLIDTCGTGGDGLSTFNISTAAALVVAAAGGAVAKHGNRGVSSPTGSADVLEAAGVVIDLDPEGAQRLIDATGFTFLFAQRFHPAMAHVAPVRRSLGIRSHFNLLGPLSNPALAEYQLLGVNAPELTRPLADALAELGTQGALVVHCGGLDEIGLHDVTVGHRVRDGRVEDFRLDPSELDVTPAPVEALAGGAPAESAALLEDVLALRADAAKHDIVVLNAGVALHLAGLADSVADGLGRARETLEQGRATELLDRVRSSSRRLAEQVA